MVSGPETYQHRPQTFNQFEEKTEARELLAAEKVLFILDLVVKREEEEKSLDAVDWKKEKYPPR